MWKGLVHIREREFYLSTGELLYCSRPLYFTTELINTSVKFASHYNLLTVSCYLDHFFQFQHSSTRVEAVCPMLVILLVHIYIVANGSKIWSVHCCLRYAFIVITILIIKLVLVPIRLPWLFTDSIFVGIFHSFEDGNYVSNIKFKKIMSTIAYY